MKAIFDFETPAFGRLVETVRLATFQAAAHEGLPALIFTLVYPAPHDDAFVEETIRVVEGAGGEVLFVHLYCDQATNEKRVTAADRRAFGKIASVDALRRTQARWRLDAAIPFRASIEIDNTELAPEEAALRIAQQLALPTRSAG